MPSDSLYSKLLETHLLLIKTLVSIFSKQHGQQNRKLWACLNQSNYSIQRTRIMSALH